MRWEFVEQSPQHKLDINYVGCQSNGQVAGAVAEWPELPPAISSGLHHTVDFALINLKLSSHAQNL